MGLGEVEMRATPIVAGDEGKEKLISLIHKVDAALGEGKSILFLTNALGDRGQGTEFKVTLSAAPISEDELETNIKRNALDYKIGDFSFVWERA